MRTVWATLSCGLAVALVGVLSLQSPRVWAQPGNGPAPAGKKYAVLVGVEEYEHGSLREPPLKYACDDADAMAEVLKKNGYEVALLTDTAGLTDPAAAPTKVNIDARIKETLRKCQAPDTVIIGLAGHGLQFAGEKDAYFCPRDARPFPDETASLVSVAGMYGELEKSFAGVKIILVDACRNDPSPARGAGLDADSVPRPPRGVAALFSCSAGQRAFEHDEFQHGVFFHHILEGLQGKAADVDGEVTFDALSIYVRRHVPRDVTRLLANQRQYPNLKADLVGVPPVLARVERIVPVNPVVPANNLPAVNPGNDVKPVAPVGGGNAGPLPVVGGGSGPVVVAPGPAPPAVAPGSGVSRPFGPLPDLTEGNNPLGPSGADLLKSLLPDDPVPPPGIAPPGVAPPGESPAGPRIAPPRTGMANLPAPPVPADTARANRLRLAEVYMDKGLELENKKEPEKAILEYDLVIGILPDHAAAYRERGRLHQEQKNLDKALADFNELIRLEPADADAWFARGRVRVDLNQNDEAIADFTQTLQLKANYPSAYFQRGVTQINKADYRSAIADFTSYLEKSPDDYAALYNRGMCWHLLLEFDKALTDYNAALKIEPTDKDTLLTRAMILQGKQEHQKAILDLSGVLSQDPRHFDALKMRAQANQFLRQYAAAITDLQAAIAVNESDAASHNDLAWLLATVPEARLRDGKSAVTHATRACELTDGKNGAYFDTLAAAYAEAGDFAKAVEWQTKGTEMAPAAEKADYQKRLDLYKARRPYRMEK